MCDVCVCGFRVPFFGGCFQGKPQRGPPFFQGVQILSTGWSLRKANGRFKQLGTPFWYSLKATATSKFAEMNFFFSFKSPVGLKGSLNALPCFPGDLSYWRSFSNFFPQKNRLLSSSTSSRQPSNQPAGQPTKSTNQPPNQPTQH